MKKPKNKHQTFFCLALFALPKCVFGVVKCTVRFFGLVWRARFSLYPICAWTYYTTLFQILDLFTFFKANVETVSVLYSSTPLIINRLPPLGLSTAFLTVCPKKKTRQKFHNLAKHYIDIRDNFTSEWSKLRLWGY